MGTTIFYYHGYVEVFLNHRWVTATPAFDSELYRILDIQPLEFDGENDSKFQKFNDAGNQYMEYLSDHGSFADVPYDLLLEKYPYYYPTRVPLDNESGLGDLHAEIESDHKQ
jgi:hypothetical protein